MPNKQPPGPIDAWVLSFAPFHDEQRHPFAVCLTKDAVLKLLRERGYSHKANQDKPGFMYFERFDPEGRGYYVHAYLLKAKDRDPIDFIYDTPHYKRVPVMQAYPEKEDHG